MKKIVLAASLLVAAATAAYADPIADRQALMKSFGPIMGSLAPVAKGEKPFDAAEVLAALTKLNEQAQKFDVPTLFPEGSNTGDTKASPKIWEDLADFQAKDDKFKADVAAAVSAPPADLATFQTQFAAIGGNCGACHQAYRLR
ncbi:c-type cytochrome [Oryzicola mucosus]|uniref:Cytochrome c n=1 Tax=Oryzicola mucosus TaxID=2767425 RepID=A0A8J6PJ85_9HYPH|nr:cytochrome c [Oryzicola mucosus]MBD0415939.1 cytochrome c [Oryzicola mucosus]